jgi:hypothetical protein
VGMPTRCMCHEAFRLENKVYKNYINKVFSEVSIL